MVLYWMRAWNPKDWTIARRESEWLAGGLDEGLLCADAVESSNKTVGERCRGRGCPERHGGSRASRVPGSREQGAGWHWQSAGRQSIHSTFHPHHSLSTSAQESERRGRCKTSKMTNTGLRRARHGQRGAGKQTIRSYVLSRALWGDDPDELPCPSAISPQRWGTGQFSTQ